MVQREAAPAAEAGWLRRAAATGPSVGTASATNSPAVVQREDDDWQGHPDPYVGQNKAVDPKDQTLGGISGTFDLSGKPPKITGAYADAPPIGSLSPSGDPLKFGADPNTAPSGGNWQGPNDPIGGNGPCPPGKTRNAVGWCQGTVAPMVAPGPVPAGPLGDWEVTDEVRNTA